MKTFLILKKIWFDKICTGEKKSEYRDNKPYYQSRLLNKPVTQVVFQVGYNSHAQRILAEVKEIKEIFREGRPTIEIVLGNIYNERNYKEMEIGEIITI